MRIIGIVAVTASAAAAAQPIEPPPATLAPVQVSGTLAPPGSSLGLDAPQDVGSRLGLTARETPASVSAMSSADIADRGLTRAQDAAVRMPGITEAPAPGNGGTALVARGFTGHNSVAQMVDGTRLVVGAGTITYPFSTWPLESVEVLRGPASVLYGDGAIGAAVNYVTKQPIWGQAQREAFVGTGSHGLLQGGVGLRGPVNDALAYSVYVDGERGDGYRRFEDFDRYDYALALAVKPMRGLKATFSLDGGVNDDARYFGTPLREGRLEHRLRRANYNVSDAVVRYDDRIWRAKVEYDAAPGLRLRNETYYMTSDRHWRNVESYAFDAAGTAVERSDYLEILHDQEQVGNRLDATLEGRIAGLRNRLVVGVDWYRTRFLHENNSPYGGSSTVDPYDFDPGRFDSPDPTRPGRRSVLQTTALFVENALDLSPAWKLVAGLRSEHMRLDNDDLRAGVRQVKRYDPLTGRLGVVWTASETLSLYGQFATATDPLSGALSLPGGGTAFDLTRGRQLEAGAKGAVPALKGEWTVALYRIEKRRLLSQDPDNPGVAQQIGRQSSTGVELAFAAEPMEGWTVDANVALLRARYDDFGELRSGVPVSRDGNVPVGVPERMANLWTTWRFAPRWKAGLGLRHVGKRPSDAANTAWLPSYTLVDASLTYDYSRRLSFTLGVRNLTDRDYALSGSGGRYWLLGQPRTVQLTARAEF